MVTRNFYDKKLHFGLFLYGGKEAILIWKNLIYSKFKKIKWKWKVVWREIFLRADKQLTDYIKETSFRMMLKLQFFQYVLNIY